MAKRKYLTSCYSYAANLSPEIPYPTLPTSLFYMEEMWVQ